MNWRIFLLAGALTVTIAAGVLAEEPAEPAESSKMTPSEAASYGIGVQFGKRLQTLGTDVDIDMVKRGMSDVLESKPLLISEQEIRRHASQLYRQKHRRRVEVMREQAEKNLAEQKAFLEENKTKEGITTLENGLQYKVIKQGKGESPGTTNRVKIEYTVRLLDGAVVDTSQRQSDNFVVQVNKVVIPGMRDALLHMKAGDKWELYVPSELGYAMAPLSRNIQPNQLYVVEVELLEVLPPPTEPLTVPTPARPN